MIYSNLIRTRTQRAHTLRDILSTERISMAVVLSLTLMLGASLLASSPAVQAQNQNPAAVEAVATVNINAADAQTMAATLKGVGESRAMEIVRYREVYGPFESAEELTEVKGIGKSTLETNRNAITLE